MRLENREDSVGHSSLLINWRLICLKNATMKSIAVYSNSYNIVKLHMRINQY